MSQDILVCASISRISAVPAPSILHEQEISRLKAEIQKLEDKINSINVKLSALVDQEKTNVENVNTETAQSTRGSTEDRLELKTNFYILMNAVNDVERSTKVLCHNFAILEEELKKPACANRTSQANLP